MSEKFVYTLILIMNCLVSAFSQVLLKKASLKNYKSFLRQYLNPLVILGYGLFFIVLFINVFLLRKLPMTVVNPIGESFPLIFSLLSGAVFFNEKITLKKIIGSMIILGGIFLIMI